MIRKNVQLLELIEGLVSGDGNGSIGKRVFAAGERVIRQEQDVAMVHVIRSGVVKCMITEDNGKDYILEFLGEGEVLGELEAIRAKPAICHVDALTPLEVYTMPAGYFRELLRSMPALNVIVMDLLATRVANSAIKGARQQLYTLSELLPQLLEALKGQGLSFSKQSLAEYLGISVRSVNRALLKVKG